MTGLGYFVFGLQLWALGLLVLAALAARLNAGARPSGKLAEMLFLFLSLHLFLNELGIGYPYSLILILSGLSVMVFMEGPEWGALYFSFGSTARYFKLAVAIAAGLSAAIGLWIFYNFEQIANPAPVAWPLDAVLVVALGFAVYMAITHEAIFRSYLMQRAVHALGGALGVSLMGVFYGLMYYRLPVINGVGGAGLGALLGVTLGWLTQKSDSIYLSMFVNFIVSGVVFMELIILAKLSGAPQ